MDISEKYTIILSNSPLIRFTKQDVARLWKNAAVELYQRDGTRISSFISDQVLMCGPISSCDQDDLCIQITCARNPVMSPKAESYYNGVREVILKVRSDLGYPHTAVLIEQIGFSYFTKI